MHRYRRILATLALLGAFDAVRGDDWPTYMADNGRSGVVAETLPEGLVEHWVVRSHEAPRPAWPPPQVGWTELPKVDFDDVFYTVADRSTVYFGSTVDNKVHAVDSATGRPRWDFTTGGPVRLAPTLAHGKVYFGSDDGKVYCVRSEDGSLVWSFDAAPNGRQVIGNGRVMSLWPVRTSVVVDGDRVYFGAGVFPYHRVFVFALDAASGKEVWKNDALTTYGGFSPQGYMLKTGNKLIVPTGRSVPICVDANDGKYLFGAPVAGTRGEATGVYGVVIDKAYFVGTQNLLTGFSTETGALAGKWANTDRLLATKDSYFVLKGPPPPAYGRKPVSGQANDITCLDRQAYQQLPRKDVEALKKVKRWRYPRPDVSAMIVAGKHLVAGAKGEVTLVDVATGKQAWVGKVDGLAMGLTVAHGRLLVSTTKGTIHCFAAGDKPAAVATKIELDGQAKGVVADILREASVRQGYAVVTGKGAGPLACQLASQSDLRVTYVVDPAHLVEQRKLVAASGLYGRVVVEAGTPQTWPFPDFAANLVVQLDEEAPRETMRVLKPCGGISLVRTGEKWAKRVRDALPGSGWWTHQYADAGNSGSSDDHRLKGRLDVLWFGEPGPDEFPDRHQRGAAPLVMNGRVFCEGWNFLEKKTTVFCFDAYNGVRYWKTEVDGAVRLGMPTVAGNLACDADSVFVAGGTRCVRLDAITGTVKATYETPGTDTKRPAWGYLAVAEGLVFGSATLEDRPGFSETIFAFDVASGKLRWQASAREIRDTTIVHGSGKLLFVENRSPVAKKPRALDKLKQAVGGEQGPYLRHVVALDTKTGQKAWEKEADLTDCGRWQYGTWGMLQALCKNDVLVLGGAYTIYNGGKPLNEVPHRALAMSVADGKLLWNAEVGNRSRPIIMNSALLAEPLFYDLNTGTKIMKKQGNKMVPWTMGPRTGGCGSLSASECMVFGRGGYTVWRDVASGPGAAFVGMRPGCAINIIPAGGVVVQAEASSGCTCYQAIQCTVVFRPREVE